MKTRSFGSLAEGEMFESVTSCSRGRIIKIKPIKVTFGYNKKRFNAISESNYVYFFQDNRKVKVV